MSSIRDSRAGCSPIASVRSSMPPSMKVQFCAILSDFKFSLLRIIAASATAHLEEYDVFDSVSKCHHTEEVVKPTFESFGSSTNSEEHSHEDNFPAQGPEVDCPDGRIREEGGL